MRYLYQSWTRIFLAPDTGGGSGGQAPNQQQQQQQGQGSSTTFVDPTAGVDLDDLDPAVKKIIEDARTGFATLQKTVADTEAARGQEEERRKSFQSNFDKLQAQLKQLNGGQGGTDGADPRSQQLDKLTAILVKKGVEPKNAAVQAELMHEMMQEYGQVLKAEIGADLRPFATTVVSREAESAWLQVQHNDKTGVIQIPEIAEHVWSQVKIMAENGQQVTPGVVENLLGMAYFNHIKNGGTPAGQQQQQQHQPVVQQQQLPNVGRLTYPGAGAQARTPVTRDANAPRHTLDTDTDAALQTVMKDWAKGAGGVKAPDYREPTKKGGR